jgi:hypothetical protein
MRNESMYLVAFVILAILLFVMVIKSQKEGFDAPADSVSRISNLETSVSGLDTRLSKVENVQKKQNEEIENAQSNVADATASLKMIT